MFPARHNSLDIAAAEVGSAGEPKFRARWHRRRGPTCGRKVAEGFRAAGCGLARGCAWVAGGTTLLLIASGCAPFHPGFYPIGIYAVSQAGDLPLLRQTGFNLVTGPADRAFLDAAQRNGIEVLASPGTAAGPHFDPDAARRAVKALDQHPALWGWYLADEPDLNHVAPQAVARANRFLKNLRAHRPTALVLYDGTRADAYASIPDVMMIDRYPIPWLPLANFPQQVRMARLATGRGKPLLAVVQAFDWSTYPELVPGETDLRPPTYRELRCMAYCAVASGADGLLFYCFDDGRWNIRAHPQTWLALKAVVAELNAREPVLQARRVWWPWSTRYDRREDRFNAALEGAVTATMLQVPTPHSTVPSGYYVLAVNTTPKTVGWHFRAPVNLTGPVPVFGEGRALRPDAGWLGDRFAPFDVHLYGPLPCGRW